MSRQALCRRLLAICREEYLHIDLKTLTFLCEITNNDIRACLHTLQFFKQKAGGGTRISNRLTIEMLHEVPSGRKDMSHHLFNVWDKILKKKKNHNSMQSHTYHNTGANHKSVAYLKMIEKENKGFKTEWKAIHESMNSLNDNKLFEGKKQDFWENFESFFLGCDFLCPVLRFAVYLLSLIAQTIKTIKHKETNVFACFCC